MVCHPYADWLLVAKSTLSQSLSLAAGGIATCHAYADWPEVAVAVCFRFPVGRVADQKMTSENALLSDINRPRETST